MQYVRFGSTGLKVSRLCLGCMTYGSKKWREWVLAEAGQFCKRYHFSGMQILGILVQY